MNSVTQYIRVALFFLFGIALIWVVYETFSESNRYTEDGYSIRAPFEDLKQLKNGSDVRLAGVSIGNVSATELKEGQAFAILMINEQYKIPEDSIATITTAGLLGNNYVAIYPGSSTISLGKNSTINTKRTADINEVIADLGGISEKINQLLDTLSGESHDQGGLFNNLNSLIVDNKDRINRILLNFETISEKITSNEGTLGKLVNEDAVYTQLLAVTTDIQEAAKKTSFFMNHASDIVASIKDSQGALGTLLHDTSLANQIKSAIANLDSFSNKLNNNNSTLGRLISNDDLYVRADKILKKVDTAVDGVENSGPITAVGIVAGSLF